LQIRKSYYESRVYLYNNVTESGWYTAELTLYPEGNSRKLAYDDIFFDPPTSGGVGLPT
jgi:hypothetical protein